MGQVVMILDAGDPFCPTSQLLLVFLLSYTASHYNDIQPRDSFKETSTTHVSYTYLRRQLHANNNPL